MRCWYPQGIKRDDLDNIHVEQWTVPCGKCVACLSNLKRDFVWRLKQEKKTSKYCKFLTFTYNGEHIPVNNGYYTLSKKDVIKFCKRLRKLNRNLRYFIVGEYGEKYNRPHYHGMIFNCTDEEIRSAWSLNGEEIGFIKVEDVRSNGAIEYVTSYILAQDQNKNKELKERGILPPFRLMSKGLGKSYVKEETIRYHNDSLEILTYNEYGHKIVMPRYIISKVFTEENLKKVKENSKLFLEKKNVNFEFQHEMQKRKLIKQKFNLKLKRNEWNF